MTQAGLFVRSSKRFGEILPPGTERYALPSRDVFFGYYDVSPFSKDDKRILAHSTQTPLKPANSGQRLALGYFNRGEDDSFHALWNGHVWSLQQGARLQWFPLDSTSDSSSIFFNDRLNGKLCGIVLGIEDRGVVHKTPLPLYSLDRSGSFGITLDFQSLYAMRPGYGYPPSGGIANEWSYPSGSLVRLSLPTNDVEVLVTPDDVLHESSVNNGTALLRHLDHPSISPSGRLLMFFLTSHLEYGKSTELFTQDLITGSIQKMNLGQKVSHYTWLDDYRILAYRNDDPNQGYHVVSAREGKRIGATHFWVMDGHPSPISDSGDFISDTYPNRLGFQELLAFGPGQRDTTLIARLYSPISFRSAERCDLHPRISHNEESVCVDSARTGKREIYVIPAPKS